MGDVACSVALVKVSIMGCINLSFDGVFKTPSFDLGGGVEFLFVNIFICEHNRKRNKIMHGFDFFFEDMGIFHVFYLSICY